MKRLLLPLLLLAACTTSLSQSRLGSKAYEVKSEFSAYKYKMFDGYDKDNDYYVRVNLELGVVYYYFDENKVCNMTNIIPKSQSAINFYVERYNKDYVPTSNTTWRMYSTDGIADIKLIYLKDGGCFFSWTTPTE